MSFRIAASVANAVSESVGRSLSASFHATTTRSSVRASQPFAMRCRPSLSGSVTGTPTALTLAPQAYYLSQPLTGKVQNDYILHPDASYVEIVTTLIRIKLPDRLDSGLCAVEHLTSLGEVGFEVAMDLLDLGFTNAML